MVEVINRQRRHKVNAKQWRDFTKRALRLAGKQDHQASIVFVSDATMRKLNRKFRDKDYPTDVLSFPAQPEAFETDAETSLGDVVISLERARAQARANGLTSTNEIQQLILHGLLHLCGYDHEADDGEMSRLELKLRRKLEI